MAEQDTTKIQLEINAQVKNLAELQAAEKQIAALIAAYKKLNEAMSAGKKAATAASTKEGNSLGVQSGLADARAALNTIDDISKKLPGGLKSAGKFGEQLATTVTGVRKSLDEIANSKGAATTAAIGEKLGQGARWASQSVKKLSQDLDEIQRKGVAPSSKKPGAPGGALFEAERKLAELRDIAGKAPLLESKAQSAIERRESPVESQARAESNRKLLATTEAAQAARAEADAKKETAKASTSAAAETAKAAKSATVVAEQSSVAAKSSAKVLSQPAAATRQAAVEAATPVNRPTRKELEASINTPITNKFAGKTLAGGAGGQGGDGGATNALRGLAAAAERASAALSRLSTSTAGSAKAAVSGGAASSSAGVAAAPKSAIAQLQQEVLGNQQAAAALHKTLRQQEAISNPRYKQAVQERAAAQVTYSQSVNSVAAASSNAGRAIQGMARQQDAITGQIKNVLGMAAGYQVLQGIASELGQIFGHLQGGIMGFNSMLEQATVGFTTLFDNQAKSAVALGKNMSAAASLTEDVSAKIDYIRMGYGSADEAAKGMIGTIREFANVTPFRFAELQESALRMRAFGFALDEVLKKNEETGKFEGGIVAVGNAVSALGGGADSFRRITYALGQMKQAGRVYQNDMMQLANAGIGGYKYIADQLKREITTDGSGSSKMVKSQYKKLFSELQANAIETVRRLTTNGQISGEAASRAIIKGLETDFGSGMERQAKTFAGAFSTVADTSQSLVADAFLPLYNSIRDTTYELGNFLQRDDVKQRAIDFGKAVTVLVDALTVLGKQVMNIVIKSFGDFSNLLNGLSDKTRSTGMAFGAAFGGLANGIKVVLGLLENDFARSLIYAGLLTKAIFAFTNANPFLTQIMLVTTALGLLKTAYDQNFAGFRTAIDETVTNFEPLISVVQKKIIPMLAELGAAFSSSAIVTISAALEAITPAIDLIVDAIEKLLRVVKFFQGPLTALFLALGSAFVFGKIVAGFALVGRKINELMIKFDMLAQKARAAGMGMTMLPGSYGKAPGGMPINFAGDKPGPSSPNVARGAPVGRMLMNGITSGMGGIGMASMMLGGLMQFGDGAVASIGGVVQNVGMALTGFAALKSILPAGMATQLASGIKMVATNLKAMAAANFPGLAAGLAQLKTVILGMPVLGPALTQLTTAIGGVSAGLALAAIAFIAAGVAIAMAINDAQIEERAGKNADWAKKTSPTLSQYFQRPINALTTEEYVALDKIMSVAPESKLGAAAKIAKGESFTAQSDQGLFGTGFFKLHETGLTPEEEQAVVDKAAAFNAAALKYNKDMENPMTQKYWRQAQIDYQLKMVVQSDKTKGLVKDTADQMGLLVNQQKNAVKNQEYLNWLLAKAKQEMAVATSAMQTLAEGAMQAMLNPASRVNPYTGLDEANLSLDEQLQIEQEMGFAQATNAQGLVRNFDEYRDLLNSILPITDADLVNGQLSVKAVEERLKIDKERKRELEHIKAIAEAEYDLGMAQLSMYDESIDPLQRGVQMRQAQMKYAEDINKLQSEGVDIILDEVKASGQWAAATKATQKRLEELKKGQQLILDEMKNMFNDYNQDIANILSNPSLSATQRKNQIEARVKQLYDDLEKNFGITKVMMQTQLSSMNTLIDTALADIGNPTMPDINWGGELANAMEDGGYKFLTDFLVAKAKKVADLTSAVFAAANPDDALDKYALKTRDVLVKLFEARIATGIAEGKLAKDTGLQSVAGRLRMDVGYFSKTTGFQNLVTFQNLIEGKLTKLGLARGGYTGAGQLHLVGEQGPELFVPRSNGMVLNNSISSKLMGMLGGGGMAMAGANNVTINVNNPVIRNDNDIRKLANEISKAQASQFRVNGGRLS